MRNTITYQVENYLDAIPEIRAHYDAHWREMAIHQDKIPLDPDYAQYDQWARADRLHVVTVRAEGELVGYHISVVGPHLHYRSTIYAMADIYWLRPDMRFGMTGYRLFREVERTLKARGVQKICMFEKLHKKIGHAKERGVGELFRALGYAEGDKSWSKWVGG